MMDNRRTRCANQVAESQSSGVAVRAASRVFAALSLGCAVVSLCGCATPSSSPRVEPAGAEVLRVGVTPTMAPMIFKRGGDCAGLEVDLAGQLAAELGRTVRFVEVPWNKQIDALLEGRTDIIMSSMSITPARAMRIDFTQSYMKSGQTALVRRDEAQAMRIAMFTSNCRVGTQRSTTGEYAVQQELPLAKHVGFDSAQAGAQALVNKKIDVFIHDAPVNWWLASENETKGLTLIPTMLTEEYLAWGVRKDDPALRDAANAFLEKARSNGSLAAAIRRWLPRWQ